MNNLGAKLFFWGGVGSTTGANINFIYKNSNILVDCGLRQGRREDELENFNDFLYDPKSVDVLFITHAHMDHIGRVPKLVRDGFRGKIVSTAVTKELSDVALKDALSVISTRYPDKVLFDESDLKKTFDIWETVEYGQKYSVDTHIKAQFYNAGHILGSSIIVLEYENSRIAFTGDLGNSPSLLLPDAQIPEALDYMVMESVYGDRNHANRESRQGELRRALQKGIERGGAVLVPVFSIERMQVILYEINNMIEDGEIPKVSVYIDSPLGNKVTDIYRSHKELFNERAKAEIAGGDDIFDFPTLNVVSNMEESQMIHKDKAPKIILAGSGMSEGGRMIGHEAHYLTDPNSTLIFVGYQAVGTFGRKLQEGQKHIEIFDTAKGGSGKKKQVIKVKAHIESVSGYSSHMDMDHLIEFVDRINEKHNKTIKDNNELRVFVCMGEPKSSLYLVQRLRDYLGVDALYPEIGKEYLL